MGIPQQKRAWVQVLVVAWGLSLAAGAVTPAFAANAQAPPTRALVGDPAIAFQRGNLKLSEHVSGLVVVSRARKTLLGLGEVQVIRDMTEAKEQVREA